MATPTDQTHRSAEFGTVTTAVGDISYRTAGYMEKKLLERAQEEMVFERFGQAKVLPKHMTKTISWRRYNPLAPALTALTEGTTPEGQTLTFTDLSVELKQIGAVMEITDVVHDTHEDMVLNEMADIAGEQAADTVEYLRYSVLRAGTNVIYAGGAATRDALVSQVALNDLRLAYRVLRRHRARRFTKIVSATANVGTEPVSAAYFAVCHPDLESDLREIEGFVPVEKYGSTTAASPNEVGKVENFRFITSTYAEPITTADVNGTVALPGILDGTMDDAGAASATGAIVYPILIFGRDAYGIVPLQGQESIRVSVINPGKIEKSDPLGQIGYVGWKSYNATKILNDAWMVRIECLADDLGSDAWDDYYGNDADTPIVGDSFTPGTIAENPDLT